MRLFSYCLRYDDGAAPNPFGGICTLAICKPKIRSAAKIGDWVIGTGSKNVMGTDYSGKLVYAMQVTEVLTLAQYDAFCSNQLQIKIPPPSQNGNPVKERGDCIYDYKNQTLEKPTKRPGVHSEENRDRDLRGLNTLLSQHFYYFGTNAIDLPIELLSIVHNQQGHKSNSIDCQLILDFINWIESQQKVCSLNGLAGLPQLLTENRNGYSDVYSKSYEDSVEDRDAFSEICK